ncbi:MAG TPA: outer membrane beta-barrel protein [Gemmatimonadaceae bacterium]|nr:outer membrane beta-barrel protein [Gemmatimonadaceae bacterium]
MKKFFVSAALVAAMAAPLAAQSSVVTGQPSVFSLTPYVGYVAYGDHFETANGAEFTNDNGALYGVQLGIDMTPNLALVGNFGYSRTNWEFEFPGAGGESFAGDVGVWLYDGNLQLKFPFAAGAGTFSPFAQAGVGAIKFTADRNDFDADGTTNVAFNAGLGADFNVGALGLRLMVKDYISSFKWDEFRNANDPDDLRDAGTSHNFAFTLGLKLGF